MSTVIFLTPNPNGVVPINWTIFDPVYGTPMPRPAPFADDDLKPTQLGLYLQDEIKLNEKIVVSLGLRYDDVSDETFDRLGNVQTQDQGLRLFDGHVGLWLHESAYLRLRNSLVKNNDGSGIGLRQQLGAHHRFGV